MCSELDINHANQMNMKQSIEPQKPCHEKNDWFKKEINANGFAKVEC